eukprot:7023279-Ditylum_brightwellii.AAC.1
MKHARGPLTNCLGAQKMYIIISKNKIGEHGGKSSRRNTFVLPMRLFAEMRVPSQVLTSVP